MGEVLDIAFPQAQAVVVLLTPDDEARLRINFRQKSEPPHETKLTAQPRPNVLFEAGMAFGRNPTRTILVEAGPLRGLSDIAVRHTIRLSNDTIKRQELASRLTSAGCPVSYATTEWQTVKRLELLEGE